MIAKILGLSLMLAGCSLGVYSLVDFTPEKVYVWSENNYPLPFVIPIEMIKQEQGTESLCQVISFTHTAYQQCLFSVENIRPSMMRKIKIAIIDSGIDVNHPFFKGLISKKSKSFIGKTLEDKINHGTHVAGILVKNILFLSREKKVDVPFELIILKVVKLKDSKKGKLEFISSVGAVGKAIDYSISEGASLINMSLFGEVSSQSQYDEIAKAEKLNIPIVVAAGNMSTDLDNNPGYPCSAAFSNIYCVGNVNKDGELNVSSNFGKVVKYYTVGSSVVSAISNYSWNSESGTSMATPKIAALMVFAKSQHVSFQKFYGKHYVEKPMNDSSFYVSKRADVIQLDPLLDDPK